MVRCWCDGAADIVSAANSVTSVLQSRAYRVIGYTNRPNWKAPSKLADRQVAAAYRYDSVSRSDIACFAFHNKFSTGKYVTGKVCFLFLRIIIYKFL